MKRNEKIKIVFDYLLSLRPKDIIRINPLTLNAWDVTYYTKDGEFTIFWDVGSYDYIDNVKLNNGVSIEYEDIHKYHYDSRKHDYIDHRLTEVARVDSHIKHVCLIANSYFEVKPY